MTPEQQLKEDMAELMQLASFRRFLFRVIQSARIFDRTADGSQGDTSLGRRNLGLEILEMVEQGQPVQHQSGQPLLTLLQTLHEEAIQQPGETHERRKQYDRYERSDDGSD